MTNTSSPSAYLLTTTLATTLSCLALWLLVAQIIQPTAAYFPKSASDAGTFAATKGDAGTVSVTGWPRGDLATSYAVSLYSNSLASSDPEPVNRDSVQLAAIKAAQLAPYDARPWVILATQEKSESRRQQLLKMSYYTSPVSAPLFPLRLRLSTQEALPDDELSSLLEFELGVLLKHDSTFSQTLADTYHRAKANGRATIERILSSVNPTLLADFKTKAL